MYARMLVEINPKKEILKDVQYVVVDGSIKIQPVVYEWLSIQLLKCQMWGHYKEVYRKPHKLQQVWLPKKEEEPVKLVLQREELIKPTLQMEEPVLPGGVEVTVVEPSKDRGSRVSTIVPLTIWFAILESTMGRELEIRQIAGHLGIKVIAMFEAPIKARKMNKVTHCEISSKDGRVDGCFSFVYAFKMAVQRMQLVE
ncbi:hypothetical protein Ancab_013021 [Ancistrocladus abbreviatus]